MIRLPYAHLHTHYSVGYSLTTPLQYMQTLDCAPGFNDWKSCDLLFHQRFLPNPYYFSGEFYYLDESGARFYLNAWPKNRKGVIELILLTSLYHFHDPSLNQQNRFIGVAKKLKNLLFCLSLKPDIRKKLYWNAFFRLSKQVKGCLLSIENLENYKQCIQAGVHPGRIVYIPHAFRTQNASEQALCIHYAHHKNISIEKASNHRRVGKSIEVPLPNQMNLLPIPYTSELVKNLSLDTIEDYFDIHRWKNSRKRAVELYCYQSDCWQKKDLTQKDLNSCSIEDFTGRIKSRKLKSIKRISIYFPEEICHTIKNKLVIAAEL